MDISITSVEVITSLGLDLETTWKRMLKGESGIRKITRFDTTNIETKIAGQVSGEFEEHEAKYIKKRMRKLTTYPTRLGYVCAQKALEKVNLSNYSPDRIGIIMGIVNAGNSSLEMNKDSSNYIIKGMNNSLPAWISINGGFTGPAFSIATACSSSAFAIIQGAEMIKSGMIDCAIVGGTDSIINPEEIKGFNEIFALSTENKFPEKASRPFSADRDGFVIGEGAGILILERAENAEKNKNKIISNIKGYALTNEGFNIVSPQAEGEGMKICMSKAIKNSGLNIDEIDYINAHGTSTTLNDLYETQAIKNLFSNAEKIPAVSSCKSMIGHTIGAAGAIEAAITSQIVCNNTVVPTINYNADPDLDLDFVPQKSRKMNVRNAISNSFGFGGHNASIIIGK